MSSKKLTQKMIASYDCVLIATDHTAYDYDWIVRHAQLVVDTRNATVKVKAGRKKIVKSKRAFEINAMLAIVGLFGMGLFPLPWIAKLNAWFVAGYVALHVVYYVIFGLTICPVCAIRNTCPGGKLQRLVRRESERG